MVTESLKKAEKVTIKSSIVILLLSIVKALVGFFFNSLVLLTDSIHSFTDLITNFASIIGLRIAQREPSEQFPYGYFKAESLSALFISIFIIYLGYEFLMEGLQALTITSQPFNPLLTIATAVSSIIVSYGLANYLIGKGNELNIQSLVLNGKEKRVDIFTSMVVLLAVILSFYNIPLIEGIVTIIISGFIFWEGFESVKDSVYSLMDISPSKSKEQAIIQAIAKIPGVEGYGNLKLRKAGPIILGSVDVMIRQKVSVTHARKLCDQIESSAKKQVTELSDLAVKIYPYQPSEQLIAIPLKKEGGLSSKFGRASEFKLIHLKEGVVVDEELIINPYKSDDVKAGLKITKHLISKGVDSVIIKKAGEITLNTLKANLVSIHYTKKRKLSTALNEFLNSSN